MQKRERIIDLRALVRSLLEKWRILCIVGLLVGIALAGREGYAQYKVYKSAQQQEDTVKEETGTSKAEELRMINGMLDDKNAYFVNTILSRIDPTREGRATADIIVRLYDAPAEQTEGAGESEPAAETAAQTQETAQAQDTAQAQETAQTGTGEQAADAAQEDTASEETEQEDEQPEPPVSGIEYAEVQSREMNILNYYTSCIMYRMDYTEAAAALGEDPAYLPELVSVVDTAKEDSMITVKVIYPTPEGAGIILDSVLAQLQTMVPQARGIYGSHGYMTANRATSVVVDTSMYKWANARATEIIALINSRKTLDKNLSSSAPAARVIQIGKRDVVMSAAKQGVFGLAAGIIGCAVLLALYLIAAGKILSGRELNDHYGLYKIACVPGRKFETYKGPDKWAASIDAGYYNHPKRSVCLQVADANLRALMRGEAQIALVSDLSLEFIEKFAAEMNKSGSSGSGRIRYFAIPCTEQTPESVEAIGNCDAAVLVAMAEISTYKGTGDVLDAVRLLGREVAGSIVLM